MAENKHKLKVAVLMGGISSERSVSLSTGRQILQSLDPERYEAYGVDAADLPGSRRRLLPGAAEEVAAVAQAGEALARTGALASFAAIQNADSPPDVVFIALHGKFGEDGTVQGMLDLLGIPYTGSGVLASALAMDKSMAKKVLAADGIPVPESVDFELADDRWNSDWVAAQVNRIGYPLIVKPSRQGSTIGMMKVNSPDELNHALREASAYDRRILVEKFLDGTELTVGVLGNREPFALPVVEIVPAKGFYDYQAKYTPGATDEIVPARISAQASERAQQIALQSHRSLGCRGVSRVDIIAGPDGAMSVLEVNTIPGMTPTSLLPRAADAAGISFRRLLDMLIDYALEEGIDR